MQKRLLFKLVKDILMFEYLNHGTLNLFYHQQSKVRCRMNHRQKKKKLKREQLEHEMFKLKLKSVKADILHFLDLIDKKKGGAV